MKQITFTENEKCDNNWDFCDQLRRKVKFQKLKENLTTKRREIFENRKISENVWWKCVRKIDALTKKNKNKKTKRQNKTENNRKVNESLKCNFNN